MEYSIKIDRGKNFGVIMGEINEYFWSANVSSEITERCINPKNLMTSMGHINKLSIYKIEESVIGNPNLPSISTKRIVFINYDNKWIIFNKEFENMVIELVNYLDRRVRISIVK